jgi:hypothetical protein
LYNWPTDLRKAVVSTIGKPVSTSLTQPNSTILALNK